MDADVDAIDIDDDDDDDVGIFSIANDCYSADEYALTDEENDLSAVRTKRTAVNKDDAGWSVQAPTWPSRLSNVLRSRGRGFCFFASNLDSSASAHMAMSSGFSAIFTQW